MANCSTIIFCMYGWFIYNCNFTLFTSDVEQLLSYCCIKFRPENFALGSLFIAALAALRFRFCSLFVYCLHFECMPLQPNINALECTVPDSITSGRQLLVDCGDGKTVHCDCVK